MDHLSKQLVLLVLQFLKDEDIEQTAHMLEQETGLFFDLNYFERLMIAGEFDELDRYLSGFIRLHDDCNSVKIFFEIRKQKYLEALDRKDSIRAVEILGNELKVFKDISPEMYAKLLDLLTLKDLRENAELEDYSRDTTTQRTYAFQCIKQCIEAHPLIKEKLTFPNMDNSRLRALINQSLNWQHRNCKTPRSNPRISSIFVDHSCEPPNGARTQSPTYTSLMGTASNSGAFTPITTTYSQFQAGVAPLLSTLTGWAVNINHPAPPAVASGSAAPVASAAVMSTPIADASLKRPRTPQPTKVGTNHQRVEYENLMKRLRPNAIEEVIPTPIHSHNMYSENDLPKTFVIPTPIHSHNMYSENDLPKTVVIPTPIHSHNMYSENDLPKTVVIPTPVHSHNMYSENDLPKTVVRILNQGSNVVSMDFHPQKQSILLVGTDVGDIGIWEVGSSVKLTHKSFKVWDVSKLKMPVQVSLLKESIMSVNKCIWSPDGAWVGVAFSTNIIQIYHVNEVDQLRQYLEIDAHFGSVNDIAFANYKEQFHVITCGDDKTVKVWNLISGDIHYTFEGNEAPVYCIRPHKKVHLPYIFSTSLDGKIKAWVYDPPRLLVTYDAPGLGRTTMAYGDDGSRLFSCSTNKGEAYLVEWDDTEGMVKRVYSGLGKRSLDMVKFDTTKKLLAAGDDHQIKFWNMDNNNILSITNADGGLPVRPNLCFNKEGSLLSVTTIDSGIKVLANLDGIQFLQTLENRRLQQETLENRRLQQELVVTKDPSVNLIVAASPVGHVPGAQENSERVPPEASITNVESNAMVGSKQKIPDEGENMSKNWKFAEVTDPVQCASIKLPDPISTGKIARLHYALDGAWLLALDTNAKHKLWKWKCNDSNDSSSRVQATTKFSPELWRPTGKNDMRNDTSNRGPGEANPCIALTKNYSYATSCSGGKVSLFNMKTFEVMLQFGAPPPTTTFLAFTPKDNNIIAMGMEDGTIHIYNCRTDEIKGILKGHEKRITGLVFSEVLNVLVSSGADARLCVWGINGWDKQKSKSVHSKAGQSTSSLADTRVQFHINQVHFLVAQDSQIAIYDADKLESLCHWAPQDRMSAPISSATYSCDSLLVYASFCDGSVGVFDAEVLQPRCRIAPSAFMPGLSSGNTYPLVVAAHPHQPNQFAIGLTDGGVHVIEPAESEGKWGVGPSDNGVASPNDTISNKGSGLPPR